MGNTGKWFQYLLVNKEHIVLGLMPADCKQFQELKYGIWKTSKARLCGPKHAKTLSENAGDTHNNNPAYI